VSDDAPLLEALGLGRRVAEAWIWRGIDLRLRSGQVGVLVGPSGAGKSLLFRCLCGLDLPDEGQVLLRSVPLDEVDRPAARARVTYLTQTPVIVPGTVADNLDLPYQFGVHAGLERPGRDRLVKLLARLGKDETFLERSHDVLSGGEAQIVSFARVLSLDPEVLLLDEPTASLDEESARAVEELVGEWVEEGERAVLWTGHDPAQAERVRSGPRLELGGDR